MVRRSALGGIGVVYLSQFLGENELNSTEKRNYSFSKGRERLGRSCYRSNVWKHVKDCLIKYFFKSKGALNRRDYHIASIAPNDSGDRDQALRKFFFFDFEFFKFF